MSDTKVKNNIKKLSLGTAQLASSYGIANEARMGESEAAEILAFAVKKGIRAFDTAVAYGDSERLLGQHLSTECVISTKLPPFQKIPADTERWTENHIHNSINKLNVQKIDELLFHEPTQLLTETGEHIYNHVRKAQEHGLIGRIGISIYNPNEIKGILKHFDFNLVQAPLNIFDREIVFSGWLNKLHSLGIKVHVRSIFLQGLLIQKNIMSIEKFNRWRPLFDAWESWLDEQNLDALEGCISAFINNPLIERIVIGVNSKRQLSEIIEVIDSPPCFPPENLCCHDKQLINPSFWRFL